MKKEETISVEFLYQIVTSYKVRKEVELTNLPVGQVGSKQHTTGSKQVVVSSYQNRQRITPFR